MVSVNSNFMRKAALTLYQRQKKVELANSVDLDEVAHNEPPHLDLHCLPSGPCCSKHR